MNVFEKTLLAGLGLASMTVDKIEEYVNKLADEGKLSQEEGKKFFDEIIGKMNSMRGDFDSKVDDTVKKTLLRLNIATKDDIEELRKRIDHLEDRLNEKQSTDGKDLIA